MNFQEKVANRVKKSEELAAEKRACKAIDYLISHGVEKSMAISAVREAQALKIIMEML